MEAIILSGGLGTRLRSVVREVPKSMAPIEGKPFLSLLVAYLTRRGFSRVILALGYKHKLVEDYFDTHPMGVPVEYSVESVPLGTGGATRQALGVARDDSVFVLNGDTFADIDFAGLASTHRQRGAKATVCLAHVDDASRYGTVDLDADQRVVGFREKSNGDAGLVNAGVYLMERNYALERWPVGSFLLERDVLPSMAAEGVLFGFIGASVFHDIGTPESYKSAPAALSALIPRAHS
jgi:D-glycero-alpha-D-manno-heptose 1-phosphate guanylyltransferase